MLQSNQPYGRVDDGVGAGFIGGAVVGGVGYGAAAAGIGYKALKDSGKSFADLGQDLEDNTAKYMGDRYQSRYQRAKGKPIGETAAGNKAANRTIDSLISGMDEGKTKKVGKFAMGSSKRRMIGQGASILGAGILGAGIDGANN